MVEAFVDTTADNVCIGGYSIFDFFDVDLSSRSSCAGDDGAGLFRAACRASRSASIAARSSAMMPDPGVSFERACFAITAGCFICIVLAETRCQWWDGDCLAMAVRS